MSAVFNSLLSQLTALAFEGRNQRCIRSAVGRVAPLYQHIDSFSMRHHGDFCCRICVNVVSNVLVQRSKLSS